MDYFLAMFRLRYMHLLVLLLKLYYQLSYVHLPPEIRLFTTRKSINSYSDADIKLHFRFHGGNQLIRIVVWFQFTHSHTLPSRHVFSGEEALIILLYRFYYPERYVGIDREFGRDYTTCYRIFNWTINFLRAITHESYGILAGFIQFILPKVSSEIWGVG